MKNKSFINQKPEGTLKALVIICLAVLWAGFYLINLTGMAKDSIGMLLLVIGLLFMIGIGTIIAKEEWAVVSFLIALIVMCILLGTDAVGYLACGVALAGNISLVFFTDLINDLLRSKKLKKIKRIRQFSGKAA